MAGHYILCGLGKVGRRVLEYLHAIGASVVVVDNQNVPTDSIPANTRLVVGDCRDRRTLEKAGLNEAQAVLIVTSDELVNLSCTLTIRLLHSDVRIIVRMYNQNLIRRLGSAVHNVSALSVSALSSPVLALIARTGEARLEFVVEPSLRFHVSELHPKPESSLCGKRVAEVESEHRVAVLALRQNGIPPKVLEEVGPDDIVQHSAGLVVCGESAPVQALVGSNEDFSLPALFWGSTLARFGKTIWQTFTEIERPVIYCWAALVFVIVVSVGAFRLGSESHSLIEALYRTVSVMATGADMHGEEFGRESWLKVYISFLRLMGMVLTAAFTAIFTNYLVRANLRGAFEVRRIPQQGHIVVCGLGNVGFRVVEELLAQGESVVAIERKTDHPLVPTIRRRGVAVIIGDATLSETLTQARAAHAKALVAATSDELVNLEVAMQVRDICPKQRIVVRTTDAGLAEMLRNAVGIRFAMAIPELAAPAFVARLFGDQVRSLLLVDGRILLVADVLVRPQDVRLIGRTIAQLSAEFHLRVMVWLDEKKGRKSLTPDGIAEVGDSLTVIVDCNKVRSLFQAY